MPLNAKDWVGAATKPLQQAYSTLTSNKVAIPLMAASVLAPVVGSALSSGKASRKERLGEFTQDRGELADAFNAKAAEAVQAGQQSPLATALTAQHQRDNVQRPDPVAMRNGLDGMHAMMHRSKRKFPGRGASGMAELV